MRLTPRTTDLIDLTKSKNAVIKLPTESRKFDGATGKGNGPVNASGMVSSPSVPMVSGSSSIYGSGSYGEGGYGESLEIFGRFLDSFKEHDNALIECIQKGFNTIFMEK